MMRFSTMPVDCVAAASDWLRAGQAEARNLVALGQARQVVFLLLLGAVVQEQFAGA
jgi:hypothetical protein